MNAGLVSIIVPVYQVEAYLDRCIGSLVNQTYPQLEIILVDDGSPDSCPLRCDEWAAADARIKVIHKANEGLGMARNTGLEVACGEYICFCDSDDTLDLHAIETLYRLAVREGADAVVYGFHYISAKSERLGSSIPHTDRPTYAGRDVQDCFLPDLIYRDFATGKATNLEMSACATFMANSIIQGNRWRFVSEREIISEDVYSLLTLYSHVRKVAVLPEALYNYHANASSLTHTFRQDRFERNKEFYEKSICLSHRLGYNDELRKRLFGPFILNLIAAMKQIAASNAPYHNRIAAVGAILSDAYLQALLRNTDLRYEPLTRKILYYTIQKKHKTICFALLWLKAR